MSDDAKLVDELTGITAAEADRTTRAAVEYQRQNREQLIFQKIENAIQATAGSQGRSIQVELRNEKGMPREFYYNIPQIIFQHLIATAIGCGMGFLPFTTSDIPPEQAVSCFVIFALVFATILNFLCLGLVQTSIIPTGIGDRVLNYCKCRGFKTQIIAGDRGPVIEIRW